MFPAFKKTTELTLCGNKRFTIYHWAPSKVILNLPKIGRLIAVPVGTMMGSVLQGGDSLHEAIPTAVLYVLDNLENGGYEVINILLDGVEVDGIGGAIDIDKVFDGHVPDLMKLLTTVVKINYGCFFEKSGFEALVEMFQSMGLVKGVEQLDQDQVPETQTEV